LRIQIPNNWKPRGYQQPAWDYLEKGGRHAELIWHRRSGKDEVSLHRTCVAAHERTANYWHMLPLATQVRKAIWEAINPHTGKKRIDEAFPKELRETTREAEMFIKFKCGSTWQALGSDNYEGSIGSTPAGIVYSEWAQANPSARGYLRPILAENNGWQIFITTPRGKNHAHRTYKAAEGNGQAFAQLLTVEDTHILNAAQLEIERQEYISTYGPEMGQALYEQEYFCSFEAAVLGAVWGAELATLTKEKRFKQFDHDPAYPVFAALDIGNKDATSIWFYQVIANEIRFIDYLSDNFKTVDYYVSQMSGIKTEIDIVDGNLIIKRHGDEEGATHRKKYRYEQIFLPHDAKAKRLGSKKTVEEQFRECFGYSKVRVLPPLSVADGIKYVRQMLKKTWISTRCEEGFEALKAYQFQYDEKLERFKDDPLHNWASDPSDGFRYAAMGWRQYYPDNSQDKAKPKRDAYGSDDDDEREWKTA
jgi:phage terminase large subunit